MPVVVLSWTPSNLASEQERPRHAAQRAMRIQVVSDLHLKFLTGLEGKHQNPWGQRSRYRRLNVQTPTSNAPLPFQTEDGLTI